MGNFFKEELKLFPSVTSSMILSKTCENLLLVVCRLSNSSDFSNGVPAESNADICLVKIDRSLFEILIF